MSDGRVVVVTGGTRGIGFGLARELLARGCRVVVCGRSDASVRTAVAELAITITSVLHHAGAEPASVLPAIRAFHELRPLSPEEVAAIWPIVVSCVVEIAVMSGVLSIRGTPQPAPRALRLSSREPSTGCRAGPSIAAGRAMR